MKPKCFTGIITRAAAFQTLQGRFPCVQHATFRSEKQKAGAVALAFCCVIHKNIIFSSLASFTPLELDRQAQYLKGAYTYRQGYYSITPNQ